MAEGGNEELTSSGLLQILGNFYQLKEGNHLKGIPYKPSRCKNFGPYNSIELENISFSSHISTFMLVV